MNEQAYRKLWVIKFCLKVVYPKYNHYCFLVYLSIKYRIWCQRRNSKRKAMDCFEVKSIPLHLVKSLIKERLDDNLPVLLNKCIIISKEQFIQLGSENLFYLDNGVLWVALKLCEDERRKHLDKKNKESQLNVLYVSPEIHRKPRSETAQNDVENIRIVPIVGSKYVSENKAFTNENEFYNIASCFGLSTCKDITITFHPVPNLDSSPKIAASAEVGLIVNNYDLDNDFIKEVLHNHFETPKLVSIYDIFSIDLTPDMTTKYHFKYLDLVQSTGRLYFKCNKLFSDFNECIDEANDKVVATCFIVRGVTQLTLGENIHCLKPKDEFFKPHLDKGLNNILKQCPTGLKHKFKQLQDTIHPFLTGEMNEVLSAMSTPLIPMVLLTGSTGSGRHLLVKVLAKYNGMNLLPVDCNALQCSTAKQTESKINSTVQKAKAAAPIIVVLDNFEVFAVDSENNEDCRVLEFFMNIITVLYENYTKFPIIFIAITEKQDLKPNLLRLFLEKIHIPKLNVQQRFDMMEWFATVMQLNIEGEDQLSPNQLNIDKEVCLSKSSRDILKRVAAKTETFLYGDLDTLFHFAMRESYLKQHNNFKQNSPVPDLHLVQEEDFNSALESIRSLQSHHLDAPKIPKVYWDDIGGLEQLKKELLKTIEFPIKYPHLFKNSNLKRSGILLYGPPGCGKTLVAKAVSTELNVSFMSVKGPELLNMYIGQSEENVRKVFQAARASSPCIVFLDELDALAPRRGAAGDSGGASDRVVSQLLAELDGVSCGEDAESSTFVFVMGATNRPDLLEQSLLRPGRLDKLIYVGPYCGLEEKTCVLRALCRKYRLRGEVDLQAVAAALPERCTGADLLQVVSTARSAAVRDLVAKLHAGVLKESNLTPDSVVLGVNELLHGVETFRSSVTDEELAYYESMKTQM